MSLARAFTTRRMKQSLDLKETSLPQRSNTTAKGHAQSGSIRNKISAPMELTHTTNMLAYDAPDLYPQSVSSSSKGSDDESDSNMTGSSSPPTSPDIPSAKGRSISPELNHLSCYFTAPSQMLPTADAPSIPQRAPSHTKKASYENLAQRQGSRMSNQSGRSVSAKSSFSLSRSSSTSTMATSVSSGSFIQLKSPIPEVPSIPADPSYVRQMSYRRSETTAAHPFGKELEQVSEIAEDYGVKDKLQVIDEEEQELVAKGLCLFRAEDYLAEVQGLISTFFTPEPRQAHPVWI